MPADELCQHLRVLPRVVAARTPEGCEQCLASGDQWVHLRLCLECGMVGCCNDSKNKHAARHAAAAGHPVVRSFEPGESWLYCYPDDSFLDP